MTKQCLVSITILLVMVSSGACVRSPVKQDWPAELPPFAYFERIYENDEVNSEVQSRENYLTWVVRFYQGWDLYQDGWQMTTRDILTSVEDDAKKRRLESKLADLGKLIAGEWAKESGDRVIRSRELSIWGQALVKSLDRGEEEEFVNQVSSDVDALLSNRIDPAAITLKRYHGSGGSKRARDS